MEAEERVTLAEARVVEAHARGDALEMQLQQVRVGANSLEAEALLVQQFRTFGMFRI